MKREFNYGTNGIDHSNYGNVYLNDTSTTKDGSKEEDAQLEEHLSIHNARGGLKKYIYYVSSIL